MNSSSHGRMSVSRCNTHAVGVFHGGQLLVLGLALTACHTHPPVQESMRVAPNPMNQIAAQVIAAGAAKHCAEVPLSVGPKPHTPLMGCFARLGDTTYYYYQDKRGPILIAGRTWLAVRGTGDSTSKALHARLDRTYGTGVDCLTQAPQNKAWGALQRQWHPSLFTVQVLEGEGANASETGVSFMLQFIKGPFSCDALDAYSINERAIILGLGSDVFKR